MHVVDKVAYSKSVNNEIDITSWKPENIPANLFESVPELVFTADVKGNILYANKKFRDDIFNPNSEAKPLNVFDIFTPNSRKVAKQKFKEVFNGNSVSNFDIKTKTERGSFIDIQMSISPVLDSDNKVIAAFSIGRDTTDYNQVIERLRDSEEIYRSIIENSPDIIFTTDVEGKMLSINEASKRIYGFDPDEMIGRVYTDFIREEALPQILDDYQQVIAGNTVISETIVVGKDSKERHVVTVTVPITKNGVITKVQGIVRDITEYKRAEETLRRIFDSVTDGVIVTDLEGTITELNERAVELHGYNSKDVLIGTKALKLTSSPHRKEVGESIEKTIKLGLIRNIEYKILRKDGSEIWGELNASVLKDVFNKPIGLIGIIRDISERKYSENMLYKSQEKLQSIIKAIPDSIFHIDQSGTIIGEPMGYNRMVGLYRSALPGKVLYDVFPYEFADKAMAAIKDTLDSKTLQILEYKWIFPPGNNAVYEIRIVPCGINEVIAIVRDITELKNYYARLITYQQYLQSLTSQLSQAEEHERRRLAEGLHDLIGQPLAVIKMRMKAWNDILCSAGHINAVNQVQELLDSAIQNTRTLTFDLSPPVLYELGLEAGLEFLLEQFQDRYGIKYEYTDDSQDKPLEGKVSILLYRCTSELLMNIVKHAKAELVRLSIRREDNHVFISVEDNGIGFTVSDKDILSQRFGIFSIHERLNWINGSFKIQSEPGYGTLAVLKAPLM